MSEILEQLTNDPSARDDEDAEEHGDEEAVPTGPVQETDVGRLLSRAVSEDTD